MKSHLTKLIMPKNSSQRIPRALRPSPERDSQIGIKPSAKLTFEETLSHMNRGYENTQRVIQFLDTKAGAVIAFSGALFAFAAKIMAWVYEESGSSFLSKVPFPVEVLGALSGIIILCAGACCLWSAFNTIRPKGLPTPDDFTVLFPARSAGEKESTIYLDSFMSGKSRAFILNEYANQLAIVGQIVFGKIALLKRSVTALIWQGVTSILLGGLIGILALFGCFEEPNKSATYRGLIEHRANPNKKGGKKSHVTRFQFSGQQPLSVDRTH